MPSITPSIFPLYLLPSMPFRRRRSSTESTSTTSSTPPKSPTSYLSPPTPSTLRCSKCLADLIPTTSIISKGFTGRHGRAYLVSPPLQSALYTLPLPPTAALPEGDIPNTTTGRPVPRQLVTGAHTVADISCRICGSVLGWKYVQAEQEAQRYKVGKFILETKRVVSGTGWDGVGVGGGGGVGGVREGGKLGDAHGDADAGAKDDDEIEFDSQDEDECEDLFSGIWSPALAKRRRRERAAAAAGEL